MNDWKKRAHDADMIDRLRADMEEARRDFEEHRDEEPLDRGLRDKLFPNKIGERSYLQWLEVHYHDLEEPEEGREVTDSLFETNPEHSPTEPNINPPVTFELDSSSELRPVLHIRDWDKEPDRDRTILDRLYETHPELFTDEPEPADRNADRGIDR